MSQENKYKIIFAGTSEFGLPCLKSLIESDLFEVVAVITQPDKKKGRKQELTPSPVKQEAQEKGLKVWQPQRIEDEADSIQELSPDIIVVVSYGQIIPEEILNIPKYGCVNVHGSLLPRYRGAAVIPAPILNGDEKSGVTIIKMDSGLDTGDILEQKELGLEPEETAGSLHDKLAALGGEIIIPALQGYIQGNITPQPQDDSRASYKKMLKKQDGHLDWKGTAKEIERAIRALNPWPGTFGYADGKLIKILEAEPNILNNSGHLPGTLFVDNNGHLSLQCGQGVLRIKKLQPEGKKTLTAEEFLQGYQKHLPQPLE